MFGDEQQGAARYWGALREHWLLIAGIVVAALLVAVIYVEAATPRYDAEADVLVTPVNETDTTFLGFSLLDETSDPTQAVLTAGRLVTTPAVAKAAAAHGAPPADPFAGITVTPVTQSNMVAITASASDPATAAKHANAVAQGFLIARTNLFQSELRARVAQLRLQIDAIPAAQRLTSATGAALETQLGTLSSLRGANDPTLQLIAPATPPGSPSYPRKKLTLAVALVAALVLGAGLALALELVSQRINREDELVLDHRLPILARIPRLPNERIRAYLAGREPLPPAAREAYRTLRASLTSGRGESFPGVILITSASPGEGKTMTSVNLAITLAAAGQRVVLIDGDLRRPMIATVFGVGSRPNGLADLLLGLTTVDEALVEAPGHGQGLRLLLASPEHASAVDLLEADRVEAVLTDLRMEADVVVIDSPPLGEVADALPLADASDAVLVAVRLGRTRRDKLADLRRMLAQHRIAPIGFVVTMRRRARASAYHTYGARAEQSGPAAAPPGVLPVPVESPPLRHPEAV